MKVFLGMFVLCFLALLLTLEPILRNAWELIAVIAAVLAACITVLYFQQEKIDTLEKRLEQLENKE